MAQRAHHHRRRRIAELVEDSSDDGAATRQRHVDLLEDLTRLQLQRLAALERTLLPVLDLEIAALRHADRVAAGREILEFPPSVRIGGNPSALALGRVGRACVDDVDEGAPQRLARIACVDTATDARAAGVLRRRLVCPDGGTEQRCQQKHQLDPPSPGSSAPISSRSRRHLHNRSRRYLIRRPNNIR